MEPREQILQKISRTELAQAPPVSGLLGVWHASRKEYPSAFLSFSNACQIQEAPFGFFAVSAWTAEWGTRPLPEDFQKKAPLSSAGFWAWAGKPQEGRYALQQTSKAADEKIWQLLEVCLQALELSQAPAAEPAGFRNRLGSVLKAELGVASERTRKLMAECESGNYSALSAGLRSILGQLFILPPFTGLDYLWILFSSGVGKIEFSSVLAALSELEKTDPSFNRNWRERQKTAGYLLLYFFLLRAAGENFKKASHLNPDFSRAVKNSGLVENEKTELVGLVKRFLVF